jgi:spermidine/putrescine-binding protein
MRLAPARVCCSLCRHTPSTPSTSTTGTTTSPTSTIARFESRCACKVVQDYYSDNEEMLAKLAPGASGYDLIVPTGNAVEALIRSKQLRPIETSAA